MSNAPGRPFSVLTPEQTSELWAEYQEKPYNISERARQLNIKPATLSYHLRGGKISKTGSFTWRAAVRVAFRAFYNGNRKDAARWLREAANRIEKPL